MKFATVVNRNSAMPLHRQIYEEWRRNILSGRIRSGEKAPSTREMAEALGISRSTVTDAYEQLIAEGYLEPARGSGTFVCRKLPDDMPLRPGKDSSQPKSETPIRFSRYGANLDDDYAYPPELPGAIRFSQWRPDLDEFPVALWRKLVLRYLRKVIPPVFDYAVHPNGYEPLRKEIAAYLGRRRAVECKPDQVIVVNGSQQALDLCVRLLVEVGEVVALEDPGYQGARRIFAAHGARLAPVRLDREGIVVDEIPHKARLVYVTPSHQFPSGVSMSLSRRLELIEWARVHGAVLLEDDYDSEYRYSGPPLPSMQGLSRGVPVIYAGTFSKVMFPGLRVGYVVAPRQMTERLARAKWLADRHTPVLEQAALADFLREGHLERHIRRMRRLYGQRRAALIDSLARHFGERAVALGDPAGMHVTVRFCGVEIADRAVRNKVQLASSRPCYLGEAPAGEWIFGFSALNERAIREGVRRLEG